MPYTGSGALEFVVSALAANGLIDSTGTGDISLPGSGMAASGSLLVVGVGEVIAGFALAGGAELADTGCGFRHYQQLSIDRVLLM